MEWEPFSPSHHCSDTTLSVVSLCNTEIESPHLLAIGSDLGTVDIIDLENRLSIAAFNNLHDTQVLDVEFYSRDHILSYDKYSLIHLDIEQSDRSVLYDRQDSIQCLALSNYSSKSSSRISPIIASTKKKILNFDLHLPDPITLLDDQIGVTELCLLPDERTIIGIQNEFLVTTDFRMPTKLYSLNSNIKFTRLSCNDKYLAAISKDFQLYSFELPLIPTSNKILIPYTNPLISRPAFCGDYIVIGNESGTIFVIEPETCEMEMIQSPLENPTVSIAATFSEICVSFEDDIYVFSYFDWEDNILRPLEYSDDDMIFDDEGNIVTRTEATENDKKEDWLSQCADVVLEDGECSYERYGYCEQQIFVCYTCSKDPKNPIGVCEQCSLICHDGHDVRAIGTRRRFRCDCGNDRCNQYCKNMFEAKVSENTFNRYNHNFYNRWCTCDGPDVPPMVQCICCDDWFHHECIGFFSNNRCIILNETPCLNDFVFVCNDCLSKRLTYINEFPDADPPKDIQDFIIELQKDSGIKSFTERPNYNSNQNQTKDEIIKDKEDLDDIKKRFKRDGIGFTIKGGRWIRKDDFFSFKGEPEFEDEFSKIDPTKEDKALPVSRRQKETADFMRKTYETLFENVSKEGRTVIQKSDVDTALSKNAMQLLIDRRRSRDHDDDDNSNDDEGGNII